jgi:hypothetical protein
MQRAVAWLQTSGASSKSSLRAPCSAQPG